MVNYFYSHDFLIFIAKNEARYAPAITLLFKTQTASFLAGTCTYK
jgi:hypothetical protein